MVKDPRYPVDRDWMVLVPILTAWRKENMSAHARNQTVIPHSWRRYCTDWHIPPYICTVIPIVQCRYKCLLLREKCAICSPCLKRADSGVNKAPTDPGALGPLRYTEYQNSLHVLWGLDSLLLKEGHVLWDMGESPPIIKVQTSYIHCCSLIIGNLTSVKDISKES